MNVGSNDNNSGDHDDHGTNIAKSSSSYAPPQIDEEPKIGMEFENLDIAYEFYCAYAHKIGFSVRKNYVKKKDGIDIRRTFCCSREEQRRTNNNYVNISHYHAITRVDCMAEMSCSIQTNGKFQVISFNAIHTHPFASSPIKHMLRSNRGITAAQKAVAENAEKIGMSNKSTIDFMSKQVGGREHLGFMDIDYKNYIRKKRRQEMKKGDAGAMLEYFQRMKSEDPSFFYSIQVDEDDLITNIFWADSRSIVDYEYFGDVVCFDTTYRTNGYGRPFAPFIGINHHKQTIIFGGALLYDETEDSFIWLFNTFLSAMSAKYPKTILTDESQAMANAIKEVFPNTHHRLCIWHIYQNAAKHLNHVFHASKKFSSDFCLCVYDYEYEDEWICAWNSMLHEYGLEDNDLLKEKYKVKEKWAMVYGRHIFTGDMKSTQRSESMNNVLKKYLDSKYNLLQFFEHYMRLLEDRRYKELVAEFKSGQTSPVLLANAEMLKDAVRVYTPEAFKMFESEYMKILDCTIHKVGKSEKETEYMVIYKRREHFVRFDPETSTVQCSCQKFTYLGILCSHSLKVLDKKNIKNLPIAYVVKRWTKEAKNTLPKSSHIRDIQLVPQESMGRRYTYLCHDFRKITTLASEDDAMCTYAGDSLAKLLDDLQIMKKQYCSSKCGVQRSLFDDSNRLESVPDLQNQDISPVFSGIKVKPTVGRPRKRFKDPLEIKKRSKIRSKYPTENLVQNHDTNRLENKGANRDVENKRNFYGESHQMDITDGIHKDTQDQAPAYSTIKENFFPSQGLFPHVTPIFNPNIFSSGVASHGQMTFTQLLQSSMRQSTDLMQENGDGEEGVDVVH